MCGCKKKARTSAEKVQESRIAQTGSILNWYCLKFLWFIFSFTSLGMTGLSRHANRSRAYLFKN